MSYNVLPFANRSIAQNAPVSPRDASFAEVVDIASRREAPVDIPEIPDQVWDEVEAASQLWQELRAQDREVRFDTDAVTGRVVVSLCDLDGRVVRPLPSRQTPGPDDFGPQTAA